jgi:hypothetical protein
MGVKFKHFRNIRTLINIDASDVAPKGNKSVGQQRLSRTIALLDNLHIHDFQRLMDSSAVGVSAETNDDALNVNENIQKKQRTVASEVTICWLMGIFCSKDMLLRVRELHSFLRTLSKLSLWWKECNKNTLREVAGSF